MGCSDGVYWELDARGAHVRNPPSNRNVPQHIWERDSHIYAYYKSRYDALRGMGVSDEQADQYIDAWEKLKGLFEALDPTEQDLRVTDHGDKFVELRQVIEAMCKALGEER